MTALIPEDMEINMEVVVNNNMDIIMEVVVNSTELVVNMEAVDTAAVKAVNTEHNMMEANQVVQSVIDLFII
jgi:hypothetical protein